MTREQHDQVQANEREVPIWDIPVRLFHWSLVACVTFMLVSGKTGWQFFEWHRTVGEIVLCLLLFRILWGFVGSSTARLPSLIVSPFSAFNHLKQLAGNRAGQHHGHNAAGGWAVLLLLATLLFQAGSGMFIADEDELIEGAQYGVLDSDTSEKLLHLHHDVGTALIVFVLVHIVMVTIYQLWAKQKLIQSMFTGKMRWPSSKSTPDYRPGRLMLALLCAVISVGIVATISRWY